MNCPLPKMSARDIVRLQLKALANNNQDDSGIQIAYQLASPQNRENTGPYQRFRQMIHSNYSPLLNHDTAGFLQPLRNGKQTVWVKKNGQIYYYQFSLSRQYDYKNGQPLYDPLTQQCLNRYWRTDSVQQMFPQEHFTEPSQNLDGQPLELCSKSPLTGFYRDGYCNTGPNDVGTHTVCAKVTQPFLEFTKSQGNDLSTPHPPHFPGLQPGDHWCLCANRYQQAKDQGYPLQVKRGATHRKTQDIIGNI